MMDRRRFLLTSLAGALAAPLIARGEQSRVVRIGALYIGIADADSLDLARQAAERPSY
jgi:hypothetical protein